MLLAILLATSLTVVVGTWVGLRLMRLATRTHKLPEAFAGLGLFTYGAICQPSALVGAALADHLGPLARPLSYSLGMGAYSVVLAGLAIFAWLAFGPRSAWRRALAFGLIAANIVAAAGAIRDSWPVLAVGPLKQTSPFELADNLTFGTAFLWMAIESLHYHRLLRRRMSLGLADAVVTNRMLLWGVGALASAIIVAGIVVLTMNGMGIGTQNPAASVLVALSGLVNGVCWTLAFLPPRAYLAFVERRASA